MIEVTVGNRVLAVQEGTVLAKALSDAQIPIEQPCGGRGTCGKCIVSVDGEPVCACQYSVQHAITVTVPEKHAIRSESGISETGKKSEHLCFALDIGTTTLALALVSLDDRATVRVLTETNPQRAFGADVMTRIDYCRTHAAEPLHQALIRTLNTMIARFELTEEVPMFVSGNTTMLHLFLNADCTGLGVAPYTPTFLDGQRVSGESLGLSGITQAETLPNIAAFVGADITAGLYALPTPPRGKWQLLADLGTNAEMVLYNAEKAICTAAAAGPCFEGANISCGMSATDGAVNRFSLVGGEKTVQTIGNRPPQGLCGTGLVDVIAALVEAEIIDETGALEGGAYEICRNVTLTQADVRAYQLAKSAVCSAIQTLLRIASVTPNDLEKVYISGGFSAQINLPNAVRSGLLPRAFLGKCVAVNNSSLMGTVRYALEHGDLSPYQKAVYTDLSAEKTFSDLFMENMLFV